jgi:hypothetical protein
MTRQRTPSKRPYFSWASEPSLGEVGLPPLDAHHAGALAGQLDPVHALQAGEVEETEVAERTISDVVDDLHDAAQPDFLAVHAVTDGIEPVAEMDAVRP